MFDTQRVEKNLTVVGASQYDFRPEGGDRNLKGCKLNVAAKADEAMGNKLGFDVIKVPADFDIFKLLQSKGTKFPLDLMCVVESKAKGDSLIDHIVEVKLPEAAKAQKAG